MKLKQNFFIELDTKDVTLEFPVMHKVDKVGIIVQLLLEIKLVMMRS